MLQTLPKLLSICLVLGTSFYCLSRPFCVLGYYIANHMDPKSFTERTMVLTLFIFLHVRICWCHFSMLANNILYQVFLHDSVSLHYIQIYYLQVSFDIPGNNVVHVCISLTDHWWPQSSLQAAQCVQWTQSTKAGAKKGKGYNIMMDHNSVWHLCSVSHYLPYVSPAFNLTHIYQHKDHYWVTCSMFTSPSGNVNSTDGI